MTTKPLFAPRPAAARALALGLAMLLSLALFTGCRQEDPWQESSSATSSSGEDGSAPPDTGMPKPAAGIDPLTGLAAPEGYKPTERPVAVMVANDSQALPQRGLAGASILFEMETEGGVTRLMALYTSLNTVPGSVGPVRSTRDQFLQFALPSGAYLSHIGTSVYASNLLNHLAYQDLDGIYLGDTTYAFDYERTLPRPGGKLKEHCFFTNGEMLAAGVGQLGMSTEGDTRQYFLFSDDEPKPQTRAQQVTVTYSGAASAGFIFKEDTGLYTKTAFGAAHADEDGTPLTFKNVIVLSCPVGKKPDGLVTDFNLSGGNGTYFTMGEAVDITWVKGGPGEPLRLYDMDGRELEVQPGRSYVGVISQEGGALDYGKFEAASSSNEAN